MLDDVIIGLLLNHPIITTKTLNSKHNGLTILHCVFNKCCELHCVCTKLLKVLLLLLNDERIDPNIATDEGETIMTMAMTRHHYHMYKTAKMKQNCLLTKKVLLEILKDSKVKVTRDNHDWTFSLGIHSHDIGAAMCDKIENFQCDPKYAKTKRKLMMFDSYVSEN